MPTFDSHGLKGGVWRGRLSGQDRPPARVLLIQHGEVLAEARLSPDGAGAWRVEVALPGSVLSDGVQTLLLKAVAEGTEEGAGAAGETLARLSLMAGSPLAEDLGVEVSALRAELELVKRELRRLAADLRRG